MLEYANQHDIRQRLWEELDRARAEHVAANRQFELVINDRPSDLPQPGRALQDYMRALKRFTDFTLNGTVPEDLQRPVE